MDIKKTVKKKPIDEKAEKIKKELQEEKEKKVKEEEKKEKWLQRFPSLRKKFFKVESPKNKRIP
jgi:aspartyl/asparaginyl-tRNA synthetase